MTDVNPKDHPHHRGIFLAWVETHGKKDADFWGWGEPAPTKGRKIVFGNSAGTLRDAGRGGVHRPQRMGRGWRDRAPRKPRDRGPGGARGEGLRHRPDVHAHADVGPDVVALGVQRVLRPHAGEGKLTAYDPAGEVKLPNPSHLKPESDWPAKPWYGYTLKLDDGKVAGVAVIDHPKNPPSLWHNHRDIRMLNPCVWRRPR